MDPIFEMTLAGALLAMALITLQLVIALAPVLQIEFIVASFLDQPSVHASEEFWFQKPHRKPPDKTRAIASRGLSSHSIVKHLQTKELNHQGKRGRSAIVSKIVSKTTTKIKSKDFKFSSYLPVPVGLLLC